MTNSSRLLSGFLALALLQLAPGTARANSWVGDLVYCDANANGVLDAGDHVLNAVNVHVKCTAADGNVCVDTFATTGSAHPTLDPVAFDIECAAAKTFDPAVSLDGRYLVEIAGEHGPGCNSPVSHPLPWTCTATVDPGTLPANCNVLVTPKAGGIPLDGNGNGDRCDLGIDGPFPEAQILGDNGSDPTACKALPSPAPGDALHTAIIASPASACALYNDFGYTPVKIASGPTRTIGFWKNHPSATNQFLPFQFCGQTVDQVCEAVTLLSLKGGGINNFKRQAVGATLNCAAFGCPAYVSDLVKAGSDACAAGTSFPYDSAGSVLDTFNNSGDKLPISLSQGSAQPHFCH
jgi:hypothetical protein